MALPKLETKTYTLTLPSTGQEIKYRPFVNLLWLESNFKVIMMIY